MKVLSANDIFKAQAMIAPKKVGEKPRFGRVCRSNKGIQHFGQNGGIHLSLGIHPNHAQWYKLYVVIIEIKEVQESVE
jgi:hypothetical protein